MSNLKHLDVVELQKEKIRTEKWINTLRSKLSGSKEKLKWINAYIEAKSPRGMTIAQIEKELGYKVRIVSDENSTENDKANEEAWDIAYGPFD